ncbi:hypothetical protein [Pseudomonas sp. NPDC007930]|uniref:hypothetical protein n=1 Tax=Pseudomonas sp. NPDC007930 TaxID=3364417 RepID=UPI0036E531B4
MLKSGSWRGSICDYIKGCSNKLDVVANNSPFMKKGAYLGMGIATASTLLTIRNACEVGRKGQCKKVLVVETSKLVGGQMAGAYLGTYMGGAFGGTVCVGIGIPTGGGGTIVCLVALGAGGAWLGDKVCSAVAGRFSKSMYEVIVE